MYIPINAIETLTVRFALLTVEWIVIALSIARYVEWITRTFENWSLESRVSVRFTLGVESSLWSRENWTLCWLAVVSVLGWRHVLGSFIKLRRAKMCSYCADGCKSMGFDVLCSYLPLQWGQWKLCKSSKDLEVLSWVHLLKIEMRSHNLWEMMEMSKSLLTQRFLKVG